MMGQYMMKKREDVQKSSARPAAKEGRDCLRRKPERGHAQVNSGESDWTHKAVL